LKAGGLLEKAALIALALITAWSITRLVLLSINCREEALSIRRFRFEIDKVEVRDKGTLTVVLKFRNPSPRNIEILYISCDVRCNDFFHGVYSMDLSSNPLVIEKFSKKAKEVFISSDEIGKYIGKEVEIQVYAQVKIKLNYLKDIAIKATYTSKVTL